MSEKLKTAACPLILQYYRLMEAFSKSDDEKDFFVNTQEGYIVYLDLERNEEEIEALETVILKNPELYCLIPKATFFETKKFMEGFVNEKVYDIDTKEKFLDIIQSRDAKENFVSFLYDHLTELDKWQQYFLERSRIRIIEWLRDNKFNFVFEEDLELTKNIVEKVKKTLFNPKVPKDITTARSYLAEKAKSYYSNEALNPRPKRGRPPKQATKVETIPEYSNEFYSTVSSAARPFLFMPEPASNTAALSFFAETDQEEELLNKLRNTSLSSAQAKLEEFSQKLASLQSLSGQLSLSKQAPEKNQC